MALGIREVAQRANTQKTICHTRMTKGNSVYWLGLLPSFPGYQWHYLSVCKRLPGGDAAGGDDKLSVASHLAEHLLDRPIAEIRDIDICLLQLRA